MSATFLEISNATRETRIHRTTDMRSDISVYLADSTGAGGWHDIALVATSARSLTLHVPAGLHVDVRPFGTPDSD